MSTLEEFPYTLDEFRQQLADIAAANPDNVNPVNGTGCLYSDPGNPEHRCIMGEWFWAHDREQFHRIKDSGSMAGALIEELYPDTSQAIRSFANNVQAQADNVRLDSDDTYRPHPVPWREVVIP